MTPSEVVLLRMPAGPGRVGALRPCLVLTALPGFFPSVLIAGISSKIGRTDPDTDLMIGDNHPDFEMSGLRVPSVIRGSWLVTHPAAIELPYVGRVSQKTRAIVLPSIVRALQNSAD